MNSTSVRRNLFQQNLSRRPASAGPPNGNVPPERNVLSTRPSHRLKPTASDTSSSRSIKLSDNKDIVSRDKTGGYKVDVPALPHVLVGEDGEELGELGADESEEASFNTSDLRGREKDSMTSQKRRNHGLRLTDTQEFESALVDMVMRHRSRQTSGEPDGE